MFSKTRKPRKPGNTQKRVFRMWFFTCPTGLRICPDNHQTPLKDQASSLFRTGSDTGLPSRSRFFPSKAPARCRGQVQLLNLIDQVGPQRNASGFSRLRTCTPHPQPESHYQSVGSKVTGLHEQGRGLFIIYQKGIAPSRRNPSFREPLFFAFLESGLDFSCQFAYPCFELFRVLKEGHQFIGNVQGSQDRDAGG